MSDRIEVSAGDRTVHLSSPDKELVRGVGKRAFAQHWQHVGAMTVAACHGRLVSAKRAPDGPDGDVFFQKNIPQGMPTWISTARVPSDSADDGHVDHVVLDDVGHLLALAQFGTVEIHVSTWSVDDPWRPREVVLDLDPPPDAAIDAVRTAVHHTLELCDDLELPTLLKTTGSKGFHVHVPVTGCDQERARDAAGLLATELARRHPDELTTEFRKQDRRGRVLVDWWRNSGSATAVAVWSPRVADGGPCAVPVHRGEVDHVTPDQWPVAEVPARLDDAGDPWADPPDPTDLTTVFEELA